MNQAKTLRGMKTKHATAVLPLTALAVGGFGAIVCNRTEENGIKMEEHATETNSLTNCRK
jgi:hypothetical protein